MKRPKLSNLSLGMDRGRRAAGSPSSQAAHEEEPADRVEFHLALEQYEAVKARGETPSMGVLKTLLQAYSHTLLSSNATAPEPSDLEAEKQRRSSSLFRLYLILQEMKTNGLAPDAAV